MLYARFPPKQSGGGLRPCAGPDAHAALRPGPVAPIDGQHVELADIKSLGSSSGVLPSAPQNQGLKETHPPKPPEKPPEKPRRGTAPGTSDPIPLSDFRWRAIGAAASC